MEVHATIFYTTVFKGVTGLFSLLEETHIGTVVELLEHLELTIT